MRHLRRRGRCLLRGGGFAGTGGGAAAWLGGASAGAALPEDSSGPGQLACGGGLAGGELATGGVAAGAGLRCLLAGKPSLHAAPAARPSAQAADARPRAASAESEPGSAAPGPHRRRRPRSSASPRRRRRPGVRPAGAFPGHSGRCPSAASCHARPRTAGGSRPIATAVEIAATVGAVGNAKHGARAQQIHVAREGARGSPGRWPPSRSGSARRRLPAPLIRLAMPDSV